MSSAGRPEDAMLLKSVELGGGYAPMTVLERHETNKSFIPAKARTVHDLGPFDKDLATFTNL